MCGFTHETLVMMAAKAGFAPVDRQPFGVDTTLVFRRLPASDATWFRFPNHAAAAERQWRRRTALRHFLSPKTYWRVPGRIGYFLRNRAIRSAMALKRPQKQT